MDLHVEKLIKIENLFQHQKTFSIALFKNFFLHFYQMHNILI